MDVESDKRMFHIYITNHVTGVLLCPDLYNCLFAEDWNEYYGKKVGRNEEMFFPTLVTKTCPCPESHWALLENIVWTIRGQE